ncbi:MAG: amino acid adenylation domain-containing protein [Clostridia bacterium]|nr:amino acid adenylation domain-containing protein [Clostridia bacterium]
MKTILEALDKTTVRWPDKPAFCDERESLTFAEVQHRTLSVSTALLHSGAAREPVAVLLPRTAGMIAALLGVMRAGCAYVPLDLEMGELRLQAIFAQVQPRFLLCDADTEAAARRCGFTGTALDIHTLTATAPDAAALGKAYGSILDTDPAYIVFTSGSTGAPKGVIGKHSAMLDYAEQLTKVLRVDETHVFGMQAPLYVDACLKEILSALFCGATVWLVPKKLFMLPVPLVGFLNEHRITTICWVVPALTLLSALHTFDEVVPQFLHTVAFGSEVFPNKQLRVGQKHVPARYINLYGPTECTGMSCFYEVDHDFAEGEPIPIGRPFDNTEILLLDETDRLADEGEICIRGVALCHGYWNDPVRTAKAFTQNPLRPEYPERIYRTGDRGRWDENGNLLFLGRIDNQIKHMGHRIELGELEAAAMRIDGVTSACAVFDAEKKRLGLAYTGTLDRAGLLAGLRHTVPDYMLPSRTVKLDAIPLTNNGKTDRRQAHALCFGK